MVLEPPGTLLVLIHGSGDSRLVRVDPADGSTTTITTGADLLGGGMARASNGDLVIARNTLPTSGVGSILRLSATGARMRIYLSDSFHGPSEVAIASDGAIYAAHWGTMAAGYGGRITRTEPVTALTTVAKGTNGCSAVAMSANDEVLYSYMETSQNGTRYWLAPLDLKWMVSDVTGPLLVVPTDPAVATRRSTWGSVKRSYR
jgi:hypothetical protein